MAIRKSTLKYFAESVVESLEEVASKIETIENIISGEDDNANGVSDDVEPDYAAEDEETEVPPVYDETAEEAYDNPEDYVEDTAEDDEEEVVESEDDDDEEEDEAEEENYSKRTKKAKKVTNFSAKNKKPIVENFAANRYAKVKEFLNGAM